MPTLYRQVRIFVLPTEPPTNWVENIVGRIIRPSVAGQPIEWFWFSRYAEGRDGSSGDTDLSQIPERYLHGTAENPHWRSVRYRVAIEDHAAAAFEARVAELVSTHQYAMASFLDYPWIDDLAGPRLLAEPRTPERICARAELVGRFLGAAANIYLHALGVGDSAGQFRLEVNHAYPWGVGSSLEPVRHLFVNLTGAPTQIEVQSNNNAILPHHLGEPQVIFRFDGQTRHLVGYHNWHRP